MVLLISLLLIAQGTTTSKSRWDSPDVLIEDSLGPNIAFAADYNYTTGDIYVACAIDSGYYFGDHPGWVIFRSQDHGLNWEKIYYVVFSATDLDQKEIDLVVTRDDTLYVSLLFSSKSYGYERIEYYKVYRGWAHSFLGCEQISGAEYRSQKLVRDDFNPFYLYRAYIIDFDGAPDSIRLERSTDKGTSWTNIYNSEVEQYNDCDLTVSDSTVYFTYLYYFGIAKRLRTRISRDRGMVYWNTFEELATTDTINADIKYSRVGATTTIPDNSQLVYNFCSRENAGSGNWDLLYLYSEDGGSNWSSTPDTLVKGSLSPVLCDLRGYEVAPNQWMDMTYCFTSSSPTPSFENFWCWSSEGDPANWQGTTSVATGANRSTPELIYSPPAGGGAVVFNDSLGNLWFDAPWKESGIAEIGKEKDKMRSEVVLPGSLVKLNSRGGIVYDVTGREIKELNGNSWDLTDGKNKEVKGGIYFIVNEKTGERVKLSVIK
jgi:hypothetical protein